MNRLQKNAWIEFGVAVIAALLSVVFVTSMVASNVRGITYIIALVFTCCVIGRPLSLIFHIKTNPNMMSAKE